MSLRVIGTRRAGAVPALDKPDSPLAKIAKLVPAEALGLYSAGLPFIHGAGVSQKAMLLVWATVALAFCALVRFRETRDGAGRPQGGAIAIALISFAIWLLMLPEGSTPLFIAGAGPWLSLGAIAWGTIIPLLYNGD